MPGVPAPRGELKPDLRVQILFSGDEARESGAMQESPMLFHHGATTGVTGSCHELRLDDGAGILIDCGMFQGAETAPGGRSHGDLGIDFLVSLDTRPWS